MNQPKRSPIRTIVVAHDHLFRDLLTVALAQLRGLDVVATFADEAAPLREVRALAPQVVVIDDHPDGASSVQLALALRRSQPEIGVVLLTDNRNIGLLSVNPNNLLHGWTYLINKSAHSMTTLGRAVQITAARLIDIEPGRPAPGLPDTLPSTLTERQLTILGLVAQAMTNATIAHTLNLKVKTIENQLATIYEKLELGRDRNDTHPRVKATLLYLQSHAPRLSPAASTQARGTSQSRSIAVGNR